MTRTTSARSVEEGRSRSATSRALGLAMLVAGAMVLALTMLIGLLRIIVGLPSMPEILYAGMAIFGAVVIAGMLSLVLSGGVVLPMRTPPTPMAGVRAPAWERHDFWAYAVDLPGVRRLRSAALAMLLITMLLVAGGITAFGFGLSGGGGLIALVVVMVGIVGGPITSLCLNITASRTSRAAVARWIAAADGEPGPYRTSSR